MTITSDILRHKMEGILNFSFHLQNLEKFIGGSPMINRFNYICSVLKITIEHSLVLKIKYIDPELDITPTLYFTGFRTLFLQTN